jgi:hypothetical protein
MRRLSLGIALALLTLGLVSTPARAVTRHQCRVQWYDLVSLNGENGNPEGPVPELDQRWDAMYDGAETHAEAATAADCGGVLRDYARDWGRLELLMYDLHPYDPMGRLAIAEGDRLHALHFQHLHHLSRPLERAFDRARTQAPLAAADLAPAMSTAATLDVNDRAAVRSLLHQLKAAARDSRHERRLDRALRVIGNAELSEE